MRRWGRRRMEGLLRVEGEGLGDGDGDREGDGKGAWGRWTSVTFGIVYDIHVSGHRLPGRLQLLT